MFVVYKNAHPNVTIKPINMNESVENMYNHVMKSVYQHTMSPERKNIDHVINNYFENLISKKEENCQIGCTTFSARQH